MLFFVSFISPLTALISAFIVILILKRYAFTDNKFILMSLLSILLGISVSIRDASPKTEERLVISVFKTGFEIDSGEFLRAVDALPEKGDEIRFFRSDISYRHGKKYINNFEILEESSIRREFISFLKKNHSSNLLTALASGKRNFSEDEKWIYVNGGIMHLIAISAFHIGILFLVFNFLRPFFIVPLPFKTSVNLLIFYIFKYLALLYYIYMTGFAVPTVRAALFIMFYELFVLSGRNIHKLQIYLFSLIGTAVIIPHSLESKSFMLSAVAIFTVIHIWNKLPESEVVKIISVSLSVSFILIPLTAEMNGIFPINSPLTNLIAVPFMMIVIPLTMFSQFVFPFCENFAEVILSVAEKILFIFEKETALIVKYTIDSSFAVTAPDLPETAFFYLLLVLVFLSSGKLKITAALGTVIFSALFFIPHSGNSRVLDTYVFPGNAKIISENSRTIIVESKRYFFPEKYVRKKFNKLPLNFSSFLARNGITNVEKIILKERLPEKTVNKLKKLPQFRKTVFKVYAKENAFFRRNMKKPDMIIWQEND